MAKAGFSGLSAVAGSKPVEQSSNREVLEGRVKSVLLDDGDPNLFTRLGGFQAIGAIEFDGVTNPSTGNKKGNSVGIAYPLFPNLKFYPLVGEIVTILKLPTKDVDVNPKETKNYYLPPVNVWGSVHHNAIPSYVPPPTSQQVSYQQAESGTPSSVGDEEVSTLLGNTFVEKDNIRPLLPYEGDYILEGRWGNSIRMGSTVSDPRIPNKWSEGSKDGDPLIIVRNGQTEYDDIPPWQNIVEDINFDKSSIYLTSTQQLPFFPSSNINDSFASNDSKPKTTSQYNDSQILLNSGRLTFNASVDSIVMSSPNTIHLSAERSVNIDTKSLVSISSQNIYLGSRQATERVVLGDSLSQELLRLVVVLEGLAAACNTAVAGPFPVSSLNAIGAGLDASLKDFRKVLEDPNSSILSKTVRTV